MHRRKDIHLDVNVLLIAAALLAVIFLTQVPAHAACGNVLAGDSDCDGLIDNPEETSGITLCNGIGVAGSTQVCPAQTCLPPYLRADTNLKDLFVIVTPAISNSRMAGINNRLEFVTVVRPHEITQDNVNCIENLGRRVTANQRAARIIELLDTADTSGTDDSLGWTDAVGSANGDVPYGNAFVYSERIKNWVYLKCPTATSTCRTSDNAATNRDNVTIRFIKHTTAHETGHMLTLKQLPDSQIGNHYAASSRGTRYNLDQYVYFRSSVFYMGTIFKLPEDFDNAQVR